MTTTRIYQHTDTSAPAMSGSLHSLPALLKACLVGTGGIAYGTGPDEKVAAGWTVEFEDGATGRIVFRNSLSAGGTGCCVLVTQTGASASLNTGRDWNAGTEALIDPCGSRTFTVSNAASSDPRSWVLFADELTFYIAIKPTPTTLGNANLVGAGDWESYWPGDITRYFAMVPSTANMSSYRVSAGTNNMNDNNSPILTGGRNSVVGALGAHFFAAFGYGSPGCNAAGGWSLNYSLPATNPPNGVVFTQPAYIRVGLNNEVTGRMRLLHVCDHVRDTGDFVEFIPGMETIGGIDLAQVRVHSNVNSNLYTPLFVEIA